MACHWSLRESKSPQVSMSLLSILANLNNSVLWMFSTCPPISKSPSPCNDHFVTVLKATIIIGITINLVFHSFSNSKYCSSFPFLFILPCGQQGQQSPQIGEFYFLLVVWLRLDDLFVCQNQRVFCVSHFPGQMMGWAYTICSYGQTLFSCTISSGSLGPSHRIKSYRISVLICCIRL